MRSSFSGGCRRALAATHAAAFLLKLSPIEFGRRLPQRRRLEQPTYLKMFTNILRRQRTRVPALIAILRDDPRALEPREHFMGDRAADPIMLREAAFVEHEAAIGEA